jgi:hypothetical protein
MFKPDWIRTCMVLFSLLLIFLSPVYAGEGGVIENSCVHCHSTIPGNSFVGAKSHDWKGSVHQKHGVTCDKCHGGNPSATKKKEAHAGIVGSNNPKSKVYFKNIPSTCGKCHGAEYYKFSQSHHFSKLEATGRGPDCVTCHGSMVTSILSPGDVAGVCGRCHNKRMGVFPYIPQKVKAVLLLLRESRALLNAEKQLYHPAEGSKKALSMTQAEAALYSATLDWHTFDLDSITEHLQDMFDSLQESSHPPQKTSPLLPPVPPATGGSQ